MRYSVGQKVRIKSLDWYNENKDEDGYVDCGRCCFDEALSTLCGKVITIKTVFDDYYWANDNLYASWTDEMIEGLVEDSNELDAKAFSDGYDQGYDDGQHDISEWNLPGGYQFVDENGNVINATKIVLEKKKKEYPKTYEECCKLLDLSEMMLPRASGWNCYKINALQKLLVCRDAYWKIAGEEMGLGKPWEPDWLDDDVIKYVISYGGCFTSRGGLNFHPYILAFPTAEMRDAFKESEEISNLIEECKELL